MPLRKARNAPSRGHFVSDLEWTTLSRPDSDRLDRSEDKSNGVTKERGNSAGIENMT